MIFQYEILFDKKKKKGMLTAANIQEAQNILSKKSCTITKLDPFFINPSKFSISKKELLTFTQEVSQLLHAGLTLYESLSALCEKYENHHMHPFVLDLCDRIKLGIHFSKVLSSYEKIFDILYCSMIANAEKTGKLENALDEMIKILKKQYLLKKKIINAFLYPAMLASFCFVIIIALIFFIIPSLFDLFEGKNIHPLTKAVLSISNFFYTKKIIFLSGFSIFCISSFLFFKKIKKVIFYFPFFRSLLLEFSIVRFTRSLSILLQSGISYVDALKLSKNVIKSPLLQKEIFKAEKKVMQGEKLSSSLKKGKIMPALATRLLDVAEESSKMPLMLYHIAAIYEEELDTKLSRFTKVLQPLMLIILGFVVGIIVLSVLLPLTDVSSFI